MKRNVLIVLFFFLLSGFSYSQVYLDQFDIDQGNTYTNTGYDGSFADSEWTITANGSNGPWDPFGYNFVDEDGTVTSVDITGNNKIFIRAKASSLGTQLRVDAKDVNGFVTTIDNVTQTLVNDYVILEFTYGAYQDARNCCI